LVDRVLPMLPEKISNELCSLRPNEDKCTFSAVFIFDKKGKIAFLTRLFDPVEFEAMKVKIEELL